MEMGKIFDESADWVQISSVAVLLLVLLSTIVYYIVSRPKQTKQWTDELQGTQMSSEGSIAGPLKSIWDTARRNGSSSSSGKKNESADKPFGSSYYYAHNNPNSKGGYTDGLKMEDYQMNEPRLLSRGSLSVESDVQEPAANSDTKKVPVSEAKSRKSVVHSSGTKITRYLWDDPGDVNHGIATMRIESLPGKAGSALPWKDANITNVSANLVDEGLLVVAHSESGQYYLHLRKLYGDVQEVKCIVKPKRLLVKLYKTKNSRDRSNLEAWPRPYR